MGFWKSLGRGVQDVMSLGGTAFLRGEIAQMEALVEAYERLRVDINSCDLTTRECVSSIQVRIRLAKKTLNRARKLLGPVLSDSTRRKVPSISGAELTPSRNALSAFSKTGLNEFAPIAGGVSAGTLAYIGSWGAVQVVAHASTGIGMATIHGAAASNAGWAWFGGGSLATGGGGMALGHLVLPGIGTAIAVAFSTTMAYKELGKVRSHNTDIRQANDKNAALYRTMKSNLSSVQYLDQKLNAESECLSEVVDHAYGILFPFGVLSRLWRMLRSWLTGSFYKEEELFELRKVETAAVSFLKAFEK